MGCSASGYLPSSDSYSHDSRPSTSSTYRGTSKAVSEVASQASSILYLNQLNRVRPTSKSVIRHFHMSSKLHRQCLWHHLPQLICRGCAPSPKGPPASFTPTPGEAHVIMSTSFEDLRMLRRQIPKMDNHGFNQIHPKDNIICVVQKTMGRRYIHMREAAAWVLNGTHWFSLLKQTMMIVILCRDWSDASKFST